MRTPTILKWLSLSLGLVTLLGSTNVSAQSSNQLTIFSAQADLANNTLFVTGSNLVWKNDALPVATLSGVPVPVVLATATQMQITLPAGIAPGTYLLRVSRGNGTPQNDLFAVTLGAAGEKGDTGDPGVPGQPGAIGPQGEPGAQGPPGPSGAAGSPGPAGQPGAPGAFGATGAQGPVGPTGAKGLAWRGEWSPVALYAPDDAVAFDGSSWVALQVNVFSQPGAGADWSLLAARGAQGDVGPAGAIGATGPAGAVGPTGPTGATGPIGPQGIQGPMGFTGPIGPQGPVGPQGPPGTGGTGGSGGSGISASINMNFSIDDRSGWTHVENVSDDKCHFNIPLGFTFSGLGATVSSISLSSNGNLFFGQACSTSFSNTAMPTFISSDPILSFFWDDLFDYGSSEYFEYETTGFPGGQVFNLFFRSRLLDTTCGIDPVQVMLSIHEGSNLVSVNYIGMSGCEKIRGGAATFGIQSANGEEAVMVGFNAPVLDDNALRQNMTFRPQQD